MTSDNKQSELLKCHVCGADAVELVPGFEKFRRVTSDCRPWTSGGRLGVCRSCGCVLHAVDDIFVAESQKIYQNYDVYYQGEGSEQKTFSPGAGMPSSRSAYLLSELGARYEFPRDGALLDFGCGNGNLLRSFAEMLPSWRLSGAEFDDKHRGDVKRIPGVEAFYDNGLEGITTHFDAVTMLHSLEHVIDPTKFLHEVRNLLTGGGLLIIEVPDYTANPFDLLIADHCTHFDLNMLRRIVARAGFECIVAESGIVPKEITILARKTGTPGHADKMPEGEISFNTATNNVRAALEWLRSTREDAASIAVRGNFGIFGTSIAGTWLGAELGGAVGFYIDEDTDRTGKEFMGRPVYHPGDIPSGGNGYLAFPREIAEKIREKLQKPGVSWHVPPAPEA